MNDFVQHTPTEVVFGRNAETKTGEEAKRFNGTHAFIVYGGGSVIRSGLMERVEKSLIEAGVAYTEFGGVKPNPLLSHARLGVIRASEFRADMILAVGGGSVIDTAIAIAHGTANPGSDIWDIWTK